MRGLMVMLVIVMLMLTVGDAGGQLQTQPVVQFIPVGTWPDVDWYVYCVWECDQILTFTTIEALYQRWDYLHEAICWWDNVAPFRVQESWCNSP